MQLNETDKMALNFNNKTRIFFGNKANGFTIFGMIDDVNH